MRSYAKLSARTALTGNYIDPAASVIIMLLITLSVVFLNQLVLFYFSRFSKLFLPLSVFVLLFTLSMLRYSLSAKLLGVCENEKRSKKTTLKRRLSGGMLELCLFFLRFFYLLVFLLPPAVLTFSVYLRVKASDSSAASLAVNISGAALLLLMSLVFWGVSVQKFSKAVYYFAGNPSVSVLNAIKMSTASTQGSLMKIFRFKCSFLPWMASGILLLPLMFVLPYYEESFIFYCMYSRK
ncbi:MAG: hypothetical protein IJB45_03555 [Clostridia bacterium]|nr:hypothetical protein [Clostridia bacterium]